MRVPSNGIRNSRPFSRGNECRQRNRKEENGLYYRIERISKNHTIGSPGCMGGVHITLPGLIAYGRHFGLLDRIHSITTLSSCSANSISSSA